VRGARAMLHWTVGAAGEHPVGLVGS
jgi:hypothetical protein